MNREVYTVYWVNQRNETRKEHASYMTEEEALNSIKTWWRIHKEEHNNVQEVRTNTGALEILYGDPHYVYRIEKHVTDKPLPSRSYKLRPQGQIETQRQLLQLTEDERLFDELLEPYRDRIIEVFADSHKAMEYCYTLDGKPVIRLSEIKNVRQQL